MVVVDFEIKDLFDFSALEDAVSEGLETEFLDLEELTFTDFLDSCDLETLYVIKIFRYFIFIRTIF